MNAHHLNGLKDWFDRFTQSHLLNNASENSPLVLKVEHTERVRDNILSLCKALLLSENEAKIAEIIGLLHDIGRFPQYCRYGTFNDQKSANHAVLGIRVIEEAKLLKPFPANEKEMIIEAIRFHNAPALPRNKPESSLFFMKLIRDADKLDIWKVFADYDRNAQAPEAAIVQHLSNEPDCSPAIIGAIMEKRIARFQDMKSINDFRLLQLSWIFDINFPATFSLVAQRADVAVIAAALPDDQPGVSRAIACALDYLDTNGASG